METWFSIIMPVWNRSALVSAAIESVRAQTFADYELIIIDDGSEDDLQEVVRPYLTGNITYHKIPHRGAYAARNFGLRQAKGEFIAYLDSDNTWHPEFLSRMQAALCGRNGQNQAAYCRYNFYQKDAQRGTVYLEGVRGEEFNFNKLLEGNYIDLNTFVHSKKCLEFSGLFKEDLRRLEDWNFIIRITSRYEPVFVSEVLVNYFYGLAANTITLTQDLEFPDKTIRAANMKLKEPITIVHDTIAYRWENVGENLAESKFYNWVKMNHGELNTADFTAWGFPYMLQIEPTSLCNLACPLCPAGKNELNRPRRHMPEEEFRSLIDDMEPYLLFIVLWDWGEPLMHPRLPAMIRYAAQRDIKIVTSTNGHFFHDDDYMEAILTSGLSTLIVAIDSLHEENYQVYRQKGNLSRTIRGLKKILALKRKLNSPTLINLRMVIMKQNEGELEKMRRLARELRVDRFTVKTLNPSCGLAYMDEELLPQDPRYRRYEYKEGTFERIRLDTVCRRIWTMANIFSNGDVVPCCYDYNSELKVGNLGEKPFTQIWNSPAYRELRRKIYYQKDSIDKCRECTINFKLSPAGWFPESHDFSGEEKKLWPWIPDEVKKYVPWSVKHHLKRLMVR